MATFHPRNLTNRKRKRTSWLNRAKNGNCLRVHGLLTCEASAERILKAHKSRKHANDLFFDKSRQNSPLSLSTLLISNAGYQILEKHRIVFLKISKPFGDELRMKGRTKSHQYGFSWQWPYPIPVYPGTLLAFCTCKSQCAKDRSMKTALFPQRCTMLDGRFILNRTNSVRTSQAEK